MNTLIEIIEDIKDNKEISYGELRYAFIALESLRSLENIEFRRICENGFGKFTTPEYYLNENFNRSKIAMNSIPKEWLGEDNLPESEAYKKFHSVSKRLINKFCAEKAKEDTI